MADYPGGFPSGLELEERLLQGNLAAPGGVQARKVAHHRHVGTLAELVCQEEREVETEVAHSGLPLRPVSASHSDSSSWSNGANLRLP